MLYNHLLKRFEYVNRYGEVICYLNLDDARKIAKRENRRIYDSAYWYLRREELVRKVI